MDFMPDQRAERFQWWMSIRDHIETEGPKFDLAPAEIAAAKACAANQVAKMEATNAAQAAIDGARAAEKSDTASNEQMIRGKIRNWKTLPGFPASGTEARLALKGKEPPFNPAAFKSVIRVTIFGNKIKLDFTKGRMNAVNVYGRLRGTAAWTKLGMDSASPFYDTRPLAQPGVPEVREYMVRGVLDDLETGQDSDIAFITFGG